MGKCQEPVEISIIRGVFVEDDISMLRVPKNIGIIASLPCYPWFIADAPELYILTSVMNPLRNFIRCLCMIKVGVFYSTAFSGHVSVYRYHQEWHGLYIFSAPIDETSPAHGYILIFPCSNVIHTIIRIVITLHICCAKPYHGNFCVF